MARERMVTRTINEVMYEVMCLDTESATVCTKWYSITGDILPDDKALKQLQKWYNLDTFKLVSITNKRVEEQLYGIPELEFLKIAIKLDPETRKPM